MVVTPAKAGVQNYWIFLDSRFNGNDRKGRCLTPYETIDLHFNITGSPATMRTTRSAALARCWFTDPAMSRKRRPRG